MKFLTHPTKVNNYIIGFDPARSNSDYTTFTIFDNKILSNIKHKPTSLSNKIIELLKHYP